MNIRQSFFMVLSAIPFLSDSCESQISFYDSGQNLGNSISSRVALGDFDNDGDLDAIVSNWTYQIVQYSRIWFNDGKGIFSESTQTLPSSLYNASLGDLDGDGDLDAWMNGRVWLNDGNGNFSQSGSLYFRGHSALGDLDNDGDLDVFITYADANTNKVYFNDGTGYFSHSGQNMQQKSGNAVALGDLDNDGDLDAYVVSGANFDNPEGEPDKAWFNDGTGIFNDTGQELGNYQAGGIALGDVDRDGDLDAVVANWHHMLMPRPQPNQLWINDGNGDFTVSNQDFGTSMVSDVALADLDGDGELDAFIANGNDTNTGKANEVRMNNGNGLFHDAGLRLGNSPSLGVALGDIDGDGDVDAFIANCGVFDGGHPNKVWLNNSNIVAIEYNKTVPDLFELKQNYPNPFNSVTTIQYAIAKPSFVKLSIFNMLGHKTKTLVSEFKEIGNYSISFDATDENDNNISSGIYICQISVEKCKRHKRMLLLQ